MPPGAAGQQTNWLLLGTTSGGMFLICRAGLNFPPSGAALCPTAWICICLSGIKCPSPCVCVCFKIFFCIYKMLRLLCTLFLLSGFGSDLAAQPLQLRLSIFGLLLYWLWCFNLWWHVFVPNFLPSDFLVLRFGLCHRNHDSSRPNITNTNITSTTTATTFSSATVITTHPGQIFHFSLSERSSQCRKRMTWRLLLLDKYNFFYQQ